VLTVGLRTGGSARTLTYNLATGGVSAGAWHHLAATFNSSTRQLTIYIDGTQRAQSILTAVSVGNSLPLILGRSGPTGEYFQGKLDNVRLWNVVRTAAEIQGNYQVEIGCAAPGLVGYWRFNEGSGPRADDCAGATSEDAILQGGSAWSTDVPVLLGSATTESLEADVASRDSEATDALEIEGAPVAARYPEATERVVFAAGLRSQSAEAVPRRSWWDEHGESLSSALRLAHRGLQGLMGSAS